MLFVPFNFGKISHPNLISVHFHNLSRSLFFCSRNNRYKVGFTDGEERQLEIIAILSPSLPSVSSGITCPKLTASYSVCILRVLKTEHEMKVWKETKANITLYIYHVAFLVRNTYTENSAGHHVNATRRSQIAEFRLQHSAVRESNEPSLGEIYQ